MLYTGGFDSFLAGGEGGGNGVVDPYLFEDAGLAEHVATELAGSTPLLGSGDVEQQHRAARVRWAASPLTFNPAWAGADARPPRDLCCGHRTLGTYLARRPIGQVCPGRRLETGGCVPHGSCGGCYHENGCGQRGHAHAKAPSFGG